MALRFMDLQLIDVTDNLRVMSRYRLLPVEIDGKMVIMGQRFTGGTEFERIDRAAAWVRDVCGRPRHRCKQ
jgi:hypothetical protein